MKALLEPLPVHGPEKDWEPPQGPERPPDPPGNLVSGLRRYKTTAIAALSIAAILLHLTLRFGLHTTPAIYRLPYRASLDVFSDTSCNPASCQKAYSPSGHCVSPFAWLHWKSGQAPIEQQ